MAKELGEMELPELLEEEREAMLDMREAAQFNDDEGGRRKAVYLDKIVAEIEKRGQCRGGLNDGCEYCKLAAHPAALVS